VVLPAAFALAQRVLAVRDAMARFNQVGDVTDAERDLAFANLQKGAMHFNIQMSETNWHQFGSQRAHHE
jgi:hypothetical protein